MKISNSTKYVTLLALALSCILFIRYIHLKNEEKIRDASINQITTTTTTTTTLSALYKMKIENIRNQLEPICSCHENDTLCMILDEFDSLKINLTSQSGFISSYKMKYFEFEQSNLACDAFSVLRRGPNQNVISISIDEQSEKIKKNHLKVLMASVKAHYPGWIIRVYHNGNINEETRCELQCLQNEYTQDFYDNIDFCNINELHFEAVDVSHLQAPFWRWLAVGDRFVERVLSRDYKWCIGERELIVVNEWLESEFAFHVIRGRFLVSVKRNCLTR